MDASHICGKLDELVSRYFQLLDELYEHRLRFDRLLKEGFLCLSKAKYSMGTRAVSPLQYETNMRALVSIEGRCESGTQSFSSNRRDPGKVKNTRDVQDGVGKSSQKQESPDVRKRKTDGGDSLLSDRIEQLSLNEIKDDEMEEIKDPLKWFGILVPGALRQGQSSFMSAVDYVAEMASLQNELVVVRKQYNDLLKEKEALMDNMNQKQIP